MCRTMAMPNAPGLPVIGPMDTSAVMDTSAGRLIFGRATTGGDGVGAVDHFVDGHGVVLCVQRAWHCLAARWVETVSLALSLLP